MDLNLAGKTAVVTGSTAGIGFAIAEGLVRQNAHVWINGRTQARVDSALARIKGSQPSAQLSGIAADLSTADGARRLTDAVAELDILVNNYGGAERVAPFLDLSDADWRQVFDANVMSGMRLARHYLPGLRAKNWGRIVFISSEAGVHMPPGFPHYGVAKAAEIALSRAVAETLGGTGVTANCVLPGPTFSEGAEKWAAREGKTEAELAAAYFPANQPSSLIKRFATTDEVANLVVYVCSPAASATNGATLRVEGGVLRHPA